MKTKQSIEEEIAHIAATIKSSDAGETEELSTAAENKMRKKVSQLRGCVLILDAGLTEEMLTKMKDECIYKISVYNKRLEEYLARIPESDIIKIKELKMKSRKVYYYKTIAPEERGELKNAKHQLGLIKRILS